jgi:glycosyltransferase involved in cell wall biosynthesis
MKIEIIIPAYNCSKTLNRTLASLEAQTDEYFTVHVIDDCSIENLSPIVESHNKLNIRMTRNEKNLGCGMSRQVGIDNTDADYIAFLDSDDVLMPYAVEMWRSMASVSPDTDIFHSYFMEQIVVDDKAALRLHEDGHTWCHGKLYKVSFIRKWDIRNSPEVKYADDSYFNSICTELGKYAEIPLIMYLWTNNTSSITRDPNGSFKKDGAFDFIHAMRLSVEFVKSKGVTKLKYAQNTINNLNNLFNKLDDASKAEFDLLISEIENFVK